MKISTYQNLSTGEKKCLSVYIPSETKVIVEVVGLTQLLKYYLIDFVFTVRVKFKKLSLPNTSSTVTYQKWDVLVDS